MSICNICPRGCNIDRTTLKGYCGEGDKIRIARIAPHHFEEPPISHVNGSGTVFFSGCNMRCVYCQNRDISRNGVGKEYTEKELIEAIIKLQESGVHNLNLVTPTHFADKIAKILAEMKSKNLLSIPVVYNTSGYESIEALKALDGLFDIYMPNVKYFSSELSSKYSGAPDYFEIAILAIEEMLHQRGKYRYFESNPSLLESGVLIRHLVLPSHRKDSLEIINRIAERIDPSLVLLSIMSQYTHDFALDTPYPELHRRITSFEYSSVCDRAASLGFVGFTQSRSSASSIYTPDF